MPAGSGSQRQRRRQIGCHGENHRAKLSDTHQFDERLGVERVGRQSVTAAKICVVGGYSGGQYNPDPETGCDVVADPLASVPAPSVGGGCTYTNRVVDGQSISISPGTYCGGLQIKNASNVTLLPGVYILKDGKLDIESNSIVSGNGVSIYLKGAASKLDFRSNTQVSFKAPETGNQKGVIFFEDRSVPLNGVHKLHSNVVVKLEGAVYLSRGLLEISSNSSVAQDSYFSTVIVNKLHLRANTDLVVNADYARSSVPSYISSGTPTRLTR